MKLPSESWELSNRRLESLQSLLPMVGIGIPFNHQVVARILYPRNGSSFNRRERKERKGRELRPLLLEIALTYRVMIVALQICCESPLSALFAFSAVNPNCRI